MFTPALKLPLKDVLFSQHKVVHTSLHVVDRDWAKTTTWPPPPQQPRGHSFKLNIKQMVHFIQFSLLKLINDGSRQTLEYLWSDIFLQLSLVRDKSVISALQFCSTTKHIKCTNASFFIREYIIISRLSKQAPAVQTRKICIILYCSSAQEKHNAYESTFLSVRKSLWLSPKTHTLINPKWKIHVLIEKQYFKKCTYITCHDSYRGTVHLMAALKGKQVFIRQDRCDTVNRMHSSI